jgi:hypothetical protein
VSETSVAEQSAEAEQEPAAPARAGEAASGFVPTASPARLAGALQRLPNDAARRRYVHAMATTYGNRATARAVAEARPAERTLARLINTADVEKIAKGATGKPMEAQHLAWELIRLFAPEKSVSLAGSKYDAKQVGFKLDGTTIVVGDDVVTRVAGGGAANVGKDLKSTLSSLPDPFKQIAHGGVKVKDAPEFISMPRVIQEGAEKAWSKSLPGTKSQEQGGIITESKSGDYGFTAGKAGTSGTFSPNRKAVKKGQKLLGILHTHPYSVKEGGFTDVPFSGQDIAIMALQLDKVSVVVSGSGWFVIATSKEFEDRVKAAPTKRKLFDEIKKDWTDRFNAAPGNTKESAVIATPQTCLKYDLLYYTGHDGWLSMPPDMVKAYRAKP